jgi:hypothetical protein
MKSHWRSAAVAADEVAATAPQSGTNRAPGRTGFAMNRTNRWFALAGAVIVAATQAAVLLVGAAPAAAAAVTTLQKVAGPVSVSDSASFKGASVTCPVGKKPVGGGGWIFTDKVADGTKVSFTGLFPSDNGWVAMASEATTAMTGKWSVQAYAVCASASELPGYSLVVSTYGPSDSGREHSAAGCLGNKRAVGGGAHVPLGAGIALTQLRTFQFSFEAAAVEGGAGYTPSWDVTAFAICMDRPEGYELVSADSAAQGSEAEKFASVRCPSGKKVMSAGARIVHDLPNLGLKIVYPTSNLRDVDVFAVENKSTATDWEEIQAHAVCVS